MEKKNRFKMLTVSTLALAMAIGGPVAAMADNHGKDNDKNDKKIESKAKVNINLHFKDVNEKELAWALKHITSLASKEVFNGYQDGTFQPNKAIKRVEAITAAVRLLGLKAQAESAVEMATELNFSDANKIEKKYPWAVGYIAVAVENDLFGENDTAVQPEKAADRLWATTLLVKSLKLDAEAKAKMNTKLDFEDAEKIPAGSVGYVAVAIEKGLIKGYNDNTFKPNKPVTRAELAALLGRTDEQLPDADKNAVSGTITALTNNVVSLKKADGTSVVLAIDPNAFIFRNGVKVGVSSLVAGDQIVARSYNNLVIFIEVTKEAVTPAPDLSFTDIGTINTIALNAQGKIATVSISKTVNGVLVSVIYDVADSLVIKGDVTKLTVNQLIELKGTNQIVNSIEIK